jgi:hypothetical protein
MDRFELYKELYFKEQERKNNINDSLSFPTGVITGLIAWLFFFVDQKYFPSLKSIPWWAHIFLILSLATLICSIYFVIVSFFKFKFVKKTIVTSAYNYAYIPYPREYEGYYQSRLKKNQEPNATGQNPISDEELKAALIEDFAVSCEHNIKLNEQKIGRVAKAKLFLSLSLMFNFFLLFTPSIFSATKDDKISKTKIIDTVAVTLLKKDTILIVHIDTVKHYKP